MDGLVYVSSCWNVFKQCFYALCWSITFFVCARLYESCLWIVCTNCGVFATIAIIAAKLIIASIPDLQILCDTVIYKRKTRFFFCAFQWSWRSARRKGLLRWYLSCQRVFPCPKHPIEDSVFIVSFCRLYFNFLINFHLLLQRTVLFECMIWPILC